MSALVVMVKEIVDNLRDRQTLFYALLFGPILLPLLLGGSMVASFKQIAIDFDEVTTLAVAHAERAPNLMAFLYTQNIDVEAAPDAIVEAVQQGDKSVILEVDEDYPQALREGRPAPLTLHVDQANKSSAREARRISALLTFHERTLDSLRMQHRGIDPAVFNSLDIIQNDVSTDGARGQLLASLLPFLFIMSMVMGGFYLAIDTTAGERERLSLEPLLSLPLARRDLVLGKFGATLSFMAVSVILTGISLWVLFRLFPINEFLGDVRFDGPTISYALLLVMPLVPFIAAVLIMVSAIPRSVKEAQTWLSLLMIFPMAPFFLLQFLNLRSSNVSMALPMLSQYQLLESAVQGTAIPTLHVVLSAGGTLIGAGLFLTLACRLYSRERILA